MISILIIVFISNIDLFSILYIFLHKNTAFGTDTPDHPEFTTEAHDSSIRKTDEVNSLHYETACKMEESAIILIETKVAQEKCKQLVTEMELMRETSVEIERVSAARQRSVEKMSTINMMLIDTLDALGLQPSSDAGKFIYSYLFLFIWGGFCVIPIC